MKKYLGVVITLILLISPFIVGAQLGGGVDGSLIPCEPGPFVLPAYCPIDGGVTFLIAAGLAFGGKKARDLSRKKNQ